MNTLFLTLLYHPDDVQAVTRLSRDGLQNQINALLGSGGAKSAQASSSGSSAVFGGTTTTQTQQTPQTNQTLTQKLSNLFQ